MQVLYFLARTLFPSLRIVEEPEHSFSKSKILKPETKKDNNLYTETEQQGRKTQD